MFQHNCTETSSNSVSFNDDHKIWSEILDYLYTGKITITLENMFNIYSKSKYLMLDELKTFCLIFIKKNTTHETIETIRDVAKQNSLTEIVEYCTNFLEMNFEDFTKHNEMVEWSSELVQELVKSDRLQVRSEAKVVELIVNWLNHQFDSRKVHMDQLVDAVRFSFLDHDKIYDAIDDDVFLSILKRFKVNMTAFQKNPQRVYCPRLYYKGIYMRLCGETASDIRFCRYLPNDKSLVTLNSSVEKRYGTSSTILNNKVYVIGGWIGGWIGRFSSKATNKVEVYDPVTDTWSIGPPLNIARQLFGCCTFEGKIYVFGGCSEDRNGTGFRSEVYCPDEDRWEFVPGDGPQTSQRDMNAVAVGDSIFVVHQIKKENGQFFVEIQQFKPATNEWINIPHDKCMETTKLLGHNYVAAYQSKIFLLESVNSYIVYDTEIKTFTKLSFYPKLEKKYFPHCRDLAVTTFRDSIVLFGRYSRRAEGGYDLPAAKFDLAEKLIPSRFTLQNTTLVQGPEYMAT